MIHIYCGDGKGKTTAACGLAVRMTGSGMNVLFVHFFKSGTSSEIKALSVFDNIAVIKADKHFGRYSTLDNEKKEEAAGYCNQLLQTAITAAEGYQAVILDEVISAYNYNMINRGLLLDFLESKAGCTEIVLTGRNPADELVCIADYVTEMKKIKHPYDNGIRARKGIEY